MNDCETNSNCHQCPLQYSCEVNNSARELDICIPIGVSCVDKQAIIRQLIRAREERRGQTYGLYLPSILISMFFSIIMLMKNGFTLGNWIATSILTMFYAAFMPLIIDFLSRSCGSFFYDIVYNKEKRWLKIVVVVISTFAVTAFFMWRLL